MPVYFTLVEKFFMKQLNLGPSPVIDIFGGFSFFAIDAAIRLNLFEILAGKPTRPTELSELCKCDVRGLVTLLDILETLGYIKEKNGEYSITKMTRKWLLDSSEISFKRGFEYYAPTVIDIWPHISDSLRIGKPYVNFYEWLYDKPEIAEVYQTFMISLAKMIIPSLLKKIELKEINILDVGGSHGMYSIALCNKYPQITVTIIDSSYAMPVLEKNIKAAGLEHRISLITGDVLNYNFDKKFDAVLLFNVYHEHEEEYNKMLSSRISEVLIPTGRFIILEGLKTKKVSPMIDLMQRIYGLLFFCFLGGQNYTLKEISSWLFNSNFINIKKKSLTGTGFTLINAYRK